VKVLHIIPSFAPGWRYGGPIVAGLGMTKALVRLGHEVTVFTTNIDGPGVLDVPTGEAVDLDGVKVWYFPVQRPRWYCYSSGLARALKERVQEFDVVHIHSVFLWPTTVAAAWCRRYEVPYILRPAGMLSPAMLSKAYAGSKASMLSKVRKNIYLKSFGRSDINRASAIHFTSQAEKDATDRMRLKPPRRVLPLGVELPGESVTTPVAGLRSRYPELADKKIVLHLSRLDPVKGMDILVPALAELAKTKEFAFVIAGIGDKPYEDQVRAMVDSSGLTSQTVFTGLVDAEQKWSYFADADVFVLPSYHENFGVAVVEAMASGLPVVISDRVNIWHEVKDAGAGVVTGMSPIEVAEALALLLDNAELRQRMGANGRQLVAEKFTWDIAAKRIAGLYEQVAPRRAPTVT